MSCFVASIGKLWGDGGLKDLLIESSVYAAGSVEQMKNGKQFKIHHHPKVYQLTQQSTTLYESLLTGEYEF
jgi:hypothetical protein